MGTLLFLLHAASEL